MVGERVVFNHYSVTVYRYVNAQKSENLEIWQLAGALALKIFKLKMENERLSKDFKLLSNPMISDKQKTIST